MKIKYIPILLIFITLTSYGQIKFESGYFIDNNNQKVECFIKNNDWKDNPSEFDFKLTADAPSKRATLNTVKEFGITGFSRYVNADIKIDLSSTDVNNLSKTREPEWSQEQVFLKVLVDGKAALYYYENNGLIRFFYSTSTDSSVNQLIFKEYFDQEKKDYVEQFEISSNRKFQEQLWINVRCSNTSAADIEKLEYRKSDLVKYFLHYNEFSGTTSVVYEKKKKGNSFHLNISPGINFSTLSVINTSADRFSTDFDNQLNFRIGLEAEYVLPFNKNKWGIFFEPTFQYFYDEEQMSTFIETANLNTVEFPTGLRYYFFLNQELKLFTDVLYIPSFCLNFNSTFEKQYTTQSILPSYLEIQSSQSFAFGGGIGFKKYSAEIRYYTNRNLLNNYASWYSDYQRFTLILGYRIL